MGNTQITSQGIKKALKKYNYQQAIAGYIWNGFDAKATEILLCIETNIISQITDFNIKDNGHGIIAPEKFTPFLESDKFVDNTHSRNLSNIHGKNGVGRLTFFKFASSASWETTYKKEDKKYKSSIRVDARSLDKYTDSPPLETSGETGTIVTFSGVQKITLDNFKTDINDFLCREFGWFLELKQTKKFSILINEEELDYKNNNIEDEEIVTKEISNVSFQIKFIVWKKSLNNEYSRYYFINSSGDEVHTTTTKLNQKADTFFHSIFITSSFFDHAQISLLGTPVNRNAKEEIIYEGLINFLELSLRNKRKNFLKQTSDKLIDSFEKSGVLPKFKNNDWDRHRKAELEDFIRELYMVEPKIFSSLNIEQKKIFTHFLNLILDSAERDKLIDILEGIISLEPSELDQLSNSLKTTKLSNIIKTVKLIEDRYKAIDQLKSLVFNSDLNANERDHLQKFIENHYWIIGEQYHLISAAEPKFEEALRRFIYHLRGEKPVVSIDHTDRNREMDIFMVRQTAYDSHISNVVIELKHPNIHIGSKELEQVKKYMSVILDQDDFNATNMTWEFYLIGNDFSQNKYIEREIANAKSHGEKSLVYLVENYKIYVKKWSEIFTEFELKHKFLNEKLELERLLLINQSENANNIIENISSNSAIQPPQITLAEG
jgi:flagellar biosynthesis chaperone FliJ